MKREHYQVYLTWQGYAIFHHMHCIAVYADKETADAVCRDLNKNAE